MDTTDVDSNADRAQESLTSHLFDQDLKRAAGPSGTAVRVPSDMSTWPPTVFFDAVYASAVVHHFGFGVTDILEKWGDMFYTPMKTAHTNDKHRRDEENSSSGHKAARQRHYEGRDGRRSRHNAIHPHDVLMMYQFKAMEPEKVMAYIKGCREIEAQKERKELEEKVNSWRGSLAPLSATDTP
jgi:hypothetical protein